MTAGLYVIPGSHPCDCAEAGLRMKGIDYRTVDLKLGTRPVSSLAKRLNEAGDEAVQADLRELPAHLDRVDALIANGVIGGATPNVADLQIGSSIKLLRTFGDLRPLLASRPCEHLAEGALPASVGGAPPGSLPSSWIPDRGAT